jgi:hypothetical protein
VEIDEMNNLELESRKLFSPYFFAEILFRFWKQNAKRCGFV